MTDRRVVIEVVSATRLTESEFWNKSALGISLRRHAKDTRIIPRIAFENSRPLPDVFNDSLEGPENADAIIFVHDDVWIDDNAFAKRVLEGLKSFDIVGVAGNQRRLKNQPAWLFIDENLTWDEGNLRGRVAHGPFPFGDTSTYGATPAECELLDGVFMAANKNTLNAKGIRFDPCFDFHFYDLDFCRTARATGLRLGAWPIELTHQSAGAFGSENWRKKFQLYLAKWENNSRPKVVAAESNRNSSAATPVRSFTQYFRNFKKDSPNCSGPIGHKDAVPTSSSLFLPTGDLAAEGATFRKFGNQHLAKGDLIGAADCYSHVVAVNPNDPQGFLNLGFVLKEQGHLEAAQHYLRHAVRRDPALVDAHYLLGVIAQEAGRLPEAIEDFRKTLEFKPDFELAYRDLFQALFQNGQLEEAKGILEQGISVNPDVAAFHYYLGNLFRHQEEFDQAIACYRNALSIDPNDFDAHYNIGNILQDQGKLDQAMACYRKAIELQPDYAGAHNSLGSVLQALGELDQAMACYHKAIELQPDYVDAQNNLGNIFNSKGNIGEAIACYRKALAINPDSAEVNNNLGVVLKSLGNLHEAVACYRKAIALSPEFSEGYNNLGNALKDQGNLDEAVACYGKAVLLRPNFAMAQNNLGVVFQEQHQLDKALMFYREALKSDPEFHVAKINVLHVLQYICKWEDLGLLSEEVRRIVREVPPTKDNHIPPFSFLALAGTTPEEQKICAHNCAKVSFKSQLSRQAGMGFKFKREPKPKIHIGYFSADFRNHPVSYLMAEVFELHDRDHFKISAYAFGPSDQGDMRKRLENAFDNFVEIGNLSYEEGARKIYQDRVDIVVDLTGYTQHSRSAILALRPAPIQVGYLGYLGTMGADFMDYIIADPFLIPPGYEKDYSERIAYLPSYQANDQHCAIAETPTRKECGLPEEGFVFCCFNQTYKILPDVFDVWMRLLKAVPNSVFWVYVFYTDAIENLRREAQARGVAPERLIFAKALPLDKHLARLKCADLFLDTLPYNAGTTASNALWAGLPVVTCAGETFSSRMAGSLLTALGVPELITCNLDDYYALALDLATNTPRYQAVRSKILGNRKSAPLFDSPRFTHNLEAAYTKMWEEYVHSRESKVLMAD